LNCLSTLGGRSRIGFDYNKLLGPAAKKVRVIRRQCLALLHKLASTGWGYDLCSFAGGSRFTRSKWRAFFQPCHGLVLDLGGGTGQVGDLLPAGCSYICLDIEMEKLQRQQATRNGSGLLADARSIPLPDTTVDFLTCLAVTHHLGDEQLDDALREAGRVLKLGGQFLLADAVWRPKRLPSRVLWAMDRGANPRSATDLSQFLERHFRVIKQTQFAFCHEYVAFSCVKWS
jgi:SAM-dependent methyltransferase